MSKKGEMGDGVRDRKNRNRGEKAGRKCPSHLVDFITAGFHVGTCSWECNGRFSVCVNS